MGGNLSVGHEGGLGDERGGGGEFARTRAERWVLAKRCVGLLQVRVRVLRRAASATQRVAMCMGKRPEEVSVPPGKKKGVALAICTVCSTIATDDRGSIERVIF